MIELIINDQIITGLDKIRLTKAVNDLGDLPSRQGEFSVTITAPPTKSNYLAFGMIEQINNLSRVPKQINTYYLYESGVLISNGTARILSIKNGIEFVLLSNNSDWVGLLEDRSLRDVSMSEHDYSLIPSDVAARRLNTTQMCLPNVYYNFIDGARPYDCFDLKPCFFISHIIDKIFTAIGYTLANQMNASDLAIYERIVNIPSDEWLQVSYNGISYKGSIAFSDNGGGGWNATELYVGGDKFFRGTNTIPWGYPITGKGSAVILTTNQIEIITKTIKPQSIQGFIEVEFTNNQTIPQLVELYLENFVTGLPLMTLGTLTVNTLGVKRIDYNVDVTNFAFAVNLLDAYIKLKVGTFGTNGVGTYKILDGMITIYDDGFNILPQRVSTTYEMVADVTGSLPQIKQTDLLRTIVNQFSLLLSTNTITKEVFFIPLDNVIDNISNAIDWSDRVDLTEEHEILYNFFDNYFQSNWFRYKDDEKDLLIKGREIGDSVIAYDNENLPIEGDLFVSEFSAIERETISGKEIASCKFYPDQTFNPKLGVSEITTNNLITQFVQSAPTQSNEIFFDDIAFANLIPNNYQALQRILSNGIAIKMLMRLTRADFTNMDFSVPVFLDVITQKGHVRGHFYVNQISQYNVGAHDSCEVTLIQID